MFEMIKVMLKAVLSVMYLNNNDVTIEDLVYESLSGNTNVIFSENCCKAYVCGQISKYCFVSRVFEVSLCETPLFDFVF